MSFVVAKPFNGTSRRFRKDQPVTEADDVSPHDFATLKRRGFIVAAQVEPLPASASPAAPASDAAPVKSGKADKSAGQ